MKPEVEMNNHLKIAPSKLIVSTFLVALCVRIFCVMGTPSNDQWIDLNIYRDGGQLISEGINPYDFEDNAELRNQLRTDDFAFHPWVSETQERWDYYSSSNLPLSQFYYGLIHILSNGNSFVYRLVFSIVDALLASLIAIILATHWQIKRSLLSVILVLGVGALSPTLLLWGSLFPEDKGLQILLMLLSVYCATKKKILLSSLFLGFSIAFKGLGVFIFPLCLFLILDTPGEKLKINRKNIMIALKYTFLSLTFTVIWFIPFFPEVTDMMVKRLEANIGSTVPIHGSVWTLSYEWFPEYWKTVKTITISALSLLWFYVFVIKEFNIAAVSLFLLVLFVDLTLLQGSLDRMNIGIIVSMVFFHLIDVKYAKFLGWYTIICGCYLYADLIWNTRIDQKTDAFYVGGYLALFCLYPLFYLYKNRRKNNLTCPPISAPT